MDDTQYSSSNACSRRPAGRQLLCYCVIVAENAVFWGVLQPHFEDGRMRVAMAVLYGCSVCLLVTLGVVTSMLDPSDPVMRDSRSGQTNSPHKDMSQCLYCQHCRSYVLTTSRHCRLCDRCTHRFDHHCLWINNCIGGTNYKPFVAMILAAFFNLALFVVSAALLWAEANWPLFLTEMVIVWTMGFIAVSLAVMVLGLILLHLYLISKGMTTLEFVIAKREKEVKQVQQQTSALQSRTETNDISQSSPVKGGKTEDEQPSEEQHRTDNVLQLPATAYQHELHLTQQEDKSSEQPSIQVFKQLPPPFQKPQDLFKQEDLQEFYSHHKAIKVLVGKTILIRSNSSSSHKKERRRRLPSNFLSDYDKPDQFMVYVNGHPDLASS